MSEQTPSNPETRSTFERITDRIDWPTTTVASLIATCAATVAIHGPDYKEGSLPDKVHDALTIEDDYSYTVETDRQRTQRREQEKQRVPLQSGEIKDKFTLDDGSQKWAQDFKNDPEAGNFVNENEYLSIIGRIKKSSGNGKIKSITITGYSSAEDNRANGGLQQDSVQNRELAQFRSSAVRDKLKETFNTDPQLKKFNDIEFKLGKPQEQKLTEGQIDKLQRYAKATGFSSEKEMVQAWNRNPESVGKRTRNYLEDTLGSARKIGINMVSEVDGQSVERVDSYCIDYQETSIATQKREDHSYFPLPVPILLPIPKLPARGRRKKKTPDDPIEPPKVPKPRKAPKIYELPVSASRVRHEFWRRRMERNSPHVDFNQDYRIANKAIGRWAGKRSIQAISTLAILAGINVSGENCKGKDHLPRPFLVDIMWDSIDESRGHGSSKNQEISFGVPFVESAQLTIKDGFKDNIYGLDAGKACRPEPGPRGEAVPPTLPRCSQVQITKRNGLVINRETLYSAPPYSSKVVRK